MEEIVSVIDESLKFAQRHGNIWKNWLAIGTQGTFQIAGVPRS